MIVTNTQILKIFLQFDRIFCEIFGYYFQQEEKKVRIVSLLVLNVNILTRRVLVSLKRIELIKI